MRGRYPSRAPRIVRTCVCARLQCRRGPGPRRRGEDAAATRQSWEFKRRRLARTESEGRLDAAQGCAKGWPCPALRSGSSRWVRGRLAEERDRKDEESMAPVSDSTTVAVPHE